MKEEELKKEIARRHWASMANQYGSLFEEDFDKQRLIDKEPFYKFATKILALVEEYYKSAGCISSEELPKCGFCGGVMSKNPHPGAGKTSDYLIVGTVWECIPCTVKGRHKWAERATKAEGELEKIREEAKNYVRLDKDQSLPKVPSGVGYCRNMQQDMLKANFRKIEKKIKK